MIVLHEWTYDCLYNAVETVSDFGYLSPHPESIIAHYFPQEVVSRSIVISPLFVMNTGVF